MVYFVDEVRVSSLNKMVTLLAWAPNGAYLASSGEDCQTLVWDCQTRETLDRYKTDVPLASLLWRENALFLLTTDGQLAAWREVIGASFCGVGGWATHGVGLAI